ncbi:hypothetical protein MSAN_02429600 [Mycena sanguinolenta]|uniref:DUF6830 domain-containing protein n=1 Tax=Mycena sanguinolenta TaxID=230812 RepID=A0A8H7CF62_9AGAR|nr:hypothetical protein MSAN_02429600 [Mycena sanguinolenta]
MPPCLSTLLSWRRGDLCQRWMKPREPQTPWDDTGAEPNDDAMDLDDEEPFQVPHLDGPNHEVLSKPVPKPVPKGPCRDHYPGAARTYGKEPTFMETFLEHDEHSDMRKSNLYYPFASAEEWEWAAWINRTKLTLSEIDELLKLRLTSKMHLSFTSAKDLRSRIESLPAGPKWKATVWKTPYPTKKPLTLYYRDPLCPLHPLRFWESSEKLMRIYTEWLSGDHAWEIQSQLPEGATVLGAALSSDKTQLTSMTGNRQAHPLLISLANLDMAFRTKASHHALLLLALLPIAKFLEKNKENVGVLHSRLFHAIMDFILHPLKVMARIGQMMRDPLGWRRFCFTPLVAYIVDTPESCLIAAVAGKRSSVTTAFFKQFGDPYRHPPRTAEYTIEQLQKVEKVAHPWRDLSRYVENAKQMGLSGVHRPFWRNWPLAEPHKFLTPEVLHHWLKMFYDHVCKWCILAVGAEEIDFRFSVLRPHTGMRHFKEGISKAKQTTGREHRDIQRYIVPVIAGAPGVSKSFVVTVASINDFFYHGQAPRITEAVLEGFGKEKKGPINNWWIPKLEFLQSVIPAIRNSGVPLQWSADITERAHIDLVKDPASNSNNQEHEEQITRHLDRRDKCRDFDLATAMAEAGVDFGALDFIARTAKTDNNALQEQDDDTPPLLDSTSQLLAQIDPVSRLGGTSREITDFFLLSSLLAQGRFPNAPVPFRTFMSLDNATAFQLSRDPVGRRLTVDAAGTKFCLDDFRHALAVYLHRIPDAHLVIGGKRPILESWDLPFEKIEYWKSVRIQSRSFHDPKKILQPETVNAAPPDGEWKCGRCDAVIVNTNSRFQWPASGLEGHTVCQLRMIFRVVPRDGYAQPAGTDGFLAYVQRFDIVPQLNPSTQLKGAFPEPASGMYVLKRAKRVDGTRQGDIIPLDRLRVPVELTPQFGKEADKRLKKETSLDHCDSFWLSKWFNKELFYALSQSKVS